MKKRKIEKEYILLILIFILVNVGCKQPNMDNSDNQSNSINDAVIQNDVNEIENEDNNNQSNSPNDTVIQNNGNEIEEVESEEMILRIGDKKLPVIWEDNDSVNEIKELAKEGLSISMSMYGGFEQVGYIGTSITRNDTQITTSPGDIVLYSGNQVVIFYGTNTWAYTRLGKIDVSEDELAKLFGNGDVTIVLEME